MSPRVVSFAWDPFKDHKTVVRGGFGMFYGPIDAQIPQVDLSLGVLNKNRSTVENQHNSLRRFLIRSSTPRIPAELGSLRSVPRAPYSPATVPARVTVSYPFTQILSVAQAFLFYKTPPPSFRPSSPRTGLIQCTTPRGRPELHASPRSPCSQPQRAEFFRQPMGSGIFVQNSGQLSPLTVLFSNPPNYRPPYSRAGFARHRT